MVNYDEIFTWNYTRVLFCAITHWLSWVHELWSMEFSIFSCVNSLLVTTWPLWRWYEENVTNITRKWTSDTQHDEFYCTCRFYKRMCRFLLYHGKCISSIATFDWDKTSFHFWHKIIRHYDNPKLSIGRFSYGIKYTFNNHVLYENVDVMRMYN